MTTRNKLYSIGAGIILIGGIWYGFARRGSDTAGQQRVTVTQGTVEQTVSITGKTKAIERVDLAFEQSGKVVLAIPVGTNVKAGQLLVQLDASEIGARINQARGSLASAIAQRNQYIAALQQQKAKLDELVNGARPEELQIKMDAVQAAKQDLHASYDTMVTTISDAESKAHGAVVNTMGSLFVGAPGNYSLTYNTCDIQAKIDAESLRTSAQNALNSWEADNVSLQTLEETQREAALQKSLTYLATIKKFVQRTQDTLVVECATNDSSLNTNRTNVATALTAIIAQQSALQTLAQTVASEKITVSKLTSDLELLKAGSPATTIQAQQALVDQAQATLEAHEGSIASAAANVQLYEAQGAKFALRAPFDGVVTNVAVTKGEIAGPSSPAASIMGKTGMEIEAYIPEVDIGKVSVGQAINATIDAIPNKTIGGSITYIDPAETVVDGVVSYRIIIIPKADDVEIKSGLTANISILVARHEQVIAIPNYVLTETDAGTTVTFVRPDGTTETRTIELGLRGTDGFVEVTKGLAVGDTVIATGLKTTP